MTITVEPKFVRRVGTNIPIGALLDLERDTYARPDGFSAPSIWESEYGRVIDVDWNDTYVFLTFDNGYVETFPRKHRLRVMTNAKEAGYAS